MKQKHEVQDQKKKKGIYIILTGFVICTLIIIAFLFFLSLEISPGTPPVHYNIKFNQTKSDDHYLLTINFIRQSKIDPKKYEWNILDQDRYVLFTNDLPVTSGEIGSTSNDNVTVTWFDHDKNNKLSKNDTIRIESPDQDLIGYTFNIFEPIDGFFRIISKIKLK